MGRKGQAAVVLAMATVVAAIGGTFVGPAGAAGAGGAERVVGAQAPPPGEARASFGGTCAGDSNPPGASIPLPSEASATVVVPESVELGSTVTLPVLAIDDRPGPVGRVDARATFEVTGATPATVESGAFAGSDYSPLTLTVTGGAGSVVELRLTQTSWATWVSVPGWYARYSCAAGEPSADEVTIRIPVTAPDCLGRPATVVGQADATTVTGSAGDDVIVAKATGAVVLPGGGTDLVCVSGGGGTLSWAGATNGTIAWIARGFARQAGGSSVRFQGIANLQGSDRIDLLIGDNAPNTLRGGDGADVLIGLGAPDLLDGQSGADVLLGDPTDTCLSGRPLNCPGT